MYELSLPQIIGSDLIRECEFVVLKAAYYFLEGIICLWIILVNWM